MKKTSTFLIILFTCSFSMAQIAATNTGTLHISTGTDTFFTASNFTNNSGSALANNGQLYIKGNLVNDQSAMAVGTGTLYLNGTALQTLSGSQPFRTYHLITDNTAGFTLNNNLSVTGTHTFTNGIIATSVTPNYLVYEAGAAYSGDGDTRHVNGWVKKLGATDFTFPVGNGTVERTIALNGLSAASEFNVRHLMTTPNPTNLQFPIADLDEAEYWTVNRVSGGTASVAMNWDNSKVAFPYWVLADIVVAGYDGSNWVDNGGSATGNTTTTGAITSGSVAAFNLFTFGSKTFPIPLTLIGFSANYQGSRTALNWTTVNEQNVDHFTVLRSNDNISFYPVGNNIAARNTATVQNYLTYDREPINHTAYYKLQSVDMDGHTSFSKTVSVSVNANSLLTLLANPVHDRISLTATGSLSGLFSYTISAINGQLMQKGRLNIQNAGTYHIPFTNNMAPGTYSLELSNGEKRFNFKIILR